MNQALGQNRSAGSSRPIDGATAPFVSAAGVLSADNADRDTFRTSLRRSMQLHRRLALAFALSGLVLAFAYLVAYWSSYSAQCLIYIQPAPSAALESSAPAHWPYNYDPATFDSFVQQQLLSVTQQDVLIGALHKLPAALWQQRGESEQSATDRLKDSIEVVRLGVSYQISITAHASLPETAAALANAVAASYIETMSHEQNAGDAEQLAMLRDERDWVKRELDADLAEQSALNANSGVAANGLPAARHDDPQIASIQQELVKARAEHDEAAARLTAIGTGNGHSSSALDAAAAVHAQDQLRADLDRTAATESRLNSQLAEMTRASVSATPKRQRSIDLASDVTRLQDHYSVLDEQFQNQSLESDAPGVVRLAAAATAPLHPDEFKIISNAVALLLVFVFLGMVAAIAAHKIDPRVRVASDVEKLLGVAPMAQLPDFDEVSEAVADVHLLRLAATFEYASTEGGMKSCIFTGTGPRVGVTTIAARVRDKLETMGKPAVLVDATGNTQEPFRSISAIEEPESETPRRRSTDPIALLQQVTEKNEMRPGDLVFADTAPLAVSAETECLARFADCVIVVIESGVTTRAQLRKVASLLKRLNLSAVGFVLNRVGLAKADQAFRNSLAEIEKHLRTQGRSPEWQAIRSRFFQAESARAAAEAVAPAGSFAANKLNMLEETDSSAEAQEGILAGQTAPLPDARREIEPPTWQPDDMPWWLTDALAQFEARSPATGAQPATSQDHDTPISADADSAKSVETEPLPVAEEETPQQIEGRSNEPAGMLFTVAHDDLNRAPHPASAANGALAAPEEPTITTKSRLSALRGMVSPGSLKELEEARYPADDTNEAAPATNRGSSQPVLQDQPSHGSSRLSRLRGFVSAAGLREFGRPKQPVPITSEATPPIIAASAERASTQPVLPIRPAPAQTNIASPLPDSSLTGPLRSPEPINAPKPLPDEVELLRAQLASTAKRDRRDTWEAIQILPSWRGQYRKKG